MAQDTPRFLQQQLAALLRHQSIRHVVMAVESGDGSFRWQGAVGQADPAGRPMRVETPFFIASVTKLFIATVIWQLHEQGRVDVDARLGDYLPASLIRGLHQLGGVDHTPRITLRHLLGHSSGLPDWLEDRPDKGPPLIERLLSGRDQRLPIDAVLAQVRKQLEPHFPPQDLTRERFRIRYSDTNYQLLIAIIEAVCAQPLDEVFASHLYRPLGLNHTFRPGRAPLQVHTEPATLWAGSVPLQIEQAFASVGDLYSTVTDLLRFMRALIHGAVFAEPATAMKLQQHWQRFGLPLDKAALRLPGWPIEYGQGMMRLQIPRFFSPWRAVPAVIGHTGVGGAWLFYCPARDLYLCGTLDQVDATALPFRLVPRLLSKLAL